MLPSGRASSARSLESSSRHSGESKRRYYPKRHLAWEQAELMSHGMYGDYLQRIAARYPTLTPMELRVAALVKAQMPSWRIAELLSIREETVDNHRCNIRRKIGLTSGSLMAHFTAI
jgi:DNA-binding CsgD family transcriptional regulator